MTIPATLVPANVIATLTVEERDDVAALTEAVENGDRLFTRGADLILSPNRGIQYLLLNTPNKYSIISLPSISDDEVNQMLAFDSTRIDAYHNMITSWTHSQAAWSQQFDLVMAALGNPNITSATVNRWIASLIKGAEHYSPPLSAETVMETIGSQLTDKWEPKTFTAEVLGELVRLFELHGAKSYLPQFRRWYNKARQQ